MARNKITHLRHFNKSAISTNAFDLFKPPEYVQDASANSLGSYELSRFNRFANRMGEVQELLFLAVQSYSIGEAGQVDRTLRDVRSALHEAIQSYAEAEVARWVRKWKQDAQKAAKRPALVPDRKLLEFKAALEKRARSVLADSESVTFEPWFLPRELSERIRRIQNMPTRRKWSTYYARWGCLRCGTVNSPHANNGMCHRCDTMIRARLGVVLRAADPCG